MSIEPGATWVERRRARREAPEDSVRLRALVLAAVLVSAAAVVVQGAVDVATAAASFVLIPLGYAFSHVRRTHRNVVLKVVLAVGLLVALGAFILKVNAAVSVDEARIALASLFLWVQILHSFDLPRRRDLSFSMASSVILMAEAASLSLDTSLLVFVAPYALLAGVWLYASHRAQAESQADVIAAPPLAGRRRASSVPAGSAMRVAVAGLVATGVVFLSLPRFEGLTVTGLPFSIVRQVQAGTGGTVVNPALPAQRGGAPAAIGAGYPGFGQGVDLRSRGRLSERVVLKVRATQAQLWRGQAYDRFDGVRWSAGSTDTIAVAGEPPLRLPITDINVDAFGEELVQTFYVQVEQPNIVFTAYQAAQLYFPATGVEVDEYGTVISPLLLEEGMVYSVISRVPVIYPEILRASEGREYPEGLLEQYTRLPELTPRVRALAERIARGAPTPYDKTLAAEAWLRANTRYNLDIPPEPPGTDPLDVFLFERRQGYCEHIATAMAVMLRAAGVPTRLVVGFGPGRRNAFTGYFEVAESDAHSWVEVFYPGAGWIPYDPTFGVPSIDTEGGPRFIAPEILRRVATWLGGLVPRPVREAVMGLGRGVARVAVALAGAWPVALVAGLLAAAVSVAWRRRRKRGPPPSPAAAAFLALCRTFERRGLARPGARTPSEHLARLLETDPLAQAHAEALTAIVRTFEADRFAPSPPASSEVAAATEAAERLAAAARSRS